MFVLSGSFAKALKVIVFLSVMSSGLVAFLPEEDVFQRAATNNNDIWISQMANCFTNDAIVGSSLKVHESACQQLKAVADCLWKEIERYDILVSFRSELQNILTGAVSKTQKKLCTDEKSTPSKSYPRLWNCEQQLSTIFEHCVNQLINPPMNISFKEYSFVECHRIYSMQHCIAQELLHCRSPILLDIFSGFQRNLLTKTPCVELENANEPA
ncbi:uncharacterized protein LOC134214415 [Armigeres subalbatus]|uniref:uncharacterized protein LOC134214415 n=1 Tax=Armigeres subalbatus TaxID=124917 RepID=UPI002ED33E20